MFWPDLTFPSPLFTLGISNEAQFVFTLQSIVMAQKLKGTLSFIVKVSAALNCLCFLGNCVRELDSGGKLCSRAFYRHHFIPAAPAPSVRNIFTWHLVQRVPPILRQHVLDCHSWQCVSKAAWNMCHTELLGRGDREPGCAPDLGWTPQPGTRLENKNKN